MEEVTPELILKWVQENKDDQQLIDMVSYMIFPYTSKYKASLTPRYQQGGDIEVKF